ncbi:MAG: hypothetical protein HYY03_06545 [Chloroflexi bacterium]|nr:hypothetical protein [Chloroflexota bacterium]
MTRVGRRLSRRTLLRSAALGGSGLLAAYLVGCGGDGEEAVSRATATGSITPSPRATSTSTPAPTATAAVLRWRPLSPSGPLPPARRDHSLTTNGRLLYLFGGRGADTLSDLWSYDPATNAWSEVASTDGPPARFGHNTYLDSARGRLIVFGGQNGASFFNDLWAFDVAAGGWSQLAAGETVPAPRYGAGGAPDGAGRLLVTHGFTNAGRFDDTWGYDPAQSAWTDLSPQGQRPVERCLMRAAWDGAANRLLIFGGQTNATPFLGDLWELRDGVWKELVAEPKPSPRKFYAMAFDGQGGRLLLLGGDTADGSLSDLWFFDSGANSWSEQSPEGEGPSPRFGHDAVWLADSRRLIVFGGRTAEADSNELWELSVPL